MAGLQLDEHVAEERVFWTIQRIAWVVLALFLLVAALGLLGGPGPLHRVTTGRGSALEIGYPRVQRVTTDLVLEIRAPGAGAVPTALVLPAAFFREHRVEAWTPEPDAATTVGEEVRLEFGSAERVVLHATPLSPGRKSWTLRADGAGSRDIGYLVLP